MRNLDREQDIKIPSRGARRAAKEASSPTVELESDQKPVGSLLTERTLGGEKVQGSVTLGDQVIEGRKNAMADTRRREGIRTRNDENPAF